MGPQHSRDEVGTITCLASFSTGDAEDGSVSVARLGALGLMADVANYCRIDPSLGLDTSGVVGGIRTRSFVTAGQMSQYLMGGVTCDWLFTITFQARV
jgi:predicted Kef-type K+ transport protein